MPKCCEFVDPDNMPSVTVVENSLSEIILFVIICSVDSKLRFCIQLCLNVLDVNTV